MVIRSILHGRDRRLAPKILPSPAEMGRPSANRPHVQLKQPSLTIHCHHIHGVLTMDEVKRLSLREAARRGATVANQAAPPKPTPSPLVVASQPAKPAEAGKVKAACGHEVDVGSCKPAFLAGK
jgi:hypothetical protein